MAAKKAPGRNVEEWERKTRRVVLRLPSETAETLRLAAISQEMGLSAYVAKLLDVMQKHPGVACGALLEDIRGPF